MKNKKIVAFGILGLFALALVSAVWIMHFEKSHVVNINSSPDIVFSETFGITDLDVTSTGGSHIEVLEIQNSNGIKYFNVFYIIEKIDIEDSCTDWENDVSVSVTQRGGQPLGVGASFTADAQATTPIEINVNAVEDSCPQSISVTIELIELVV